MRSLLCTLTALVGLAGLSAGQSAQSSTAVAADRIWFSPNPGTLDMLRMFERPEEWEKARRLIHVYNITQQHTFLADVIVGPNTYDALVRANAFRKLRAWGKKLSIGVGAVKEFYCTADASGMNEAIANTLKAVDAVTAAGGIVHYLSMDEPWVSGRASPACGGPALEPTGDRVALYMRSVNRVYPAVRIGLIEAYPYGSAEAIESMLELLRQRGVPPAFLHVDIDWPLLKPGEFSRDMRRLQVFCRSRGIPFGIIITGFNGDADALFARGAYGMARDIAETFRRWADMPDHLMFDSWVESRTGLRISPSNLPETSLYTHTNLLVDILLHLRRADLTAAVGRAVPRR